MNLERKITYPSNILSATCMYVVEGPVSQGIWLHRFGPGLALSGFRVEDYNLDTDVVLGLVRK